MASKNRRNYGSKTPWYCVDGPYKGQCLFLHNGGSGTASFSVAGWNNGETGRYVKDRSPAATKRVGGYLGFTIEVPVERLVWEKVKCQNPSKSM